MTISFDHTTHGQRVLFGTGRAVANTVEAVEGLGAKRVLLVADGFATELSDAITERTPVVARVHEIVQHVPIENATRTVAFARELGADAVITIGGGSSVGLAKIVARDAGLPIVAVPTTYSGSEVTPLWGLTGNGVKRRGTDSRVLPVEVVYDTELTTGLPTRLTIESALNSLAHCVDGLWAPGANPVSTALGTDAIRILARGLYAIDRADAGAVDTVPLTAREDLLLGAYLAGSALASTGPGMHHEVCQVLGGAFRLPHAALHAALLPYTFAFNAPSAPAEAERIARSLGVADALDGLSDLYDHTGSRRPLRDLGLSREDISSVTDRVLAAIPPSNPRAADMASVRHLLTAAWYSAPWREVVDHANSRSGSGAHT